MRVHEVIEEALRAIRVVPMNQPASGVMLQRGAPVLDRMLRSWQQTGYQLWTKATQDVTLTTAASYTLASRAIRILNVNLLVSGVETPLTPMTRQEYDWLPVKTSTGRPCSYYHDRQATASVVYVWPVLATAAGEVLRITYEREIADMKSDALADLDMPLEWQSAVINNLAVRLAPLYGRDASEVIPLAATDLGVALGDDREESVYFAGPEAE